MQENVICKYYILYKEVGHPRIWVWVEPTPVDTEGQLYAVCSEFMPHQDAHQHFTFGTFKPLPCTLNRVKLLAFFQCILQ